MARVTFTSNLQRHVSCPVQEATGTTLRAVLDCVFAENTRLRSYILDDQGRIRRHVAVYLNNQRVAARDGLDIAVGANDEVFVLQALSGG